MKKNVYIILFALLTIDAAAQKREIVLSLERTIEMARQQSPDVVFARHSFRSSYWNYCYYKANYLPWVTVSSTPNFNHSINPITMQDGSTKFVQQNQLITDANLSISQNITLTGGNVFINSGIQRIDIFDDNSYSYKTSPVVVGYQQSLLGYNRLKWDHRIEPIRYEEAKKSYIETLELVAARATSKFFNLAMAQSNLEIARLNNANADTFFIYGKGRYRIGSITENEMLQLEINQLTEESNLMNAQIEVEDAMEDLRSYLGITDSVHIIVEINGQVPTFNVSANQATELALNNSSDILAMKRRLLESESNVANAKASTGLKADLYAQLGLTQTGGNFGDAYKNPLNQQYVELGIRLPILDWGRGKGQVKLAKSNRDMVQTQVEQDRTHFELNLLKLVKQFNLQASKVSISEKTDNRAERRAEVARRLYLLERSTILDLNASITERNDSKRNYINELRNYWTQYYTLRSITLFNFEKNIPLTEDYELLLK